VAASQPATYTLRYPRAVRGTADKLRLLMYIGRERGIDCIEEEPKVPAPGPRCGQVYHLYSSLTDNIRVLASGTPASPGKRLQFPSLVPRLVVAPRAPHNDESSSRAHSAFQVVGTQPSYQVLAQACRMWGDTEQDALIVAQIDAHTEFIREALWGQGETYHAMALRVHPRAPQIELCSDIRLRSEFYHGTCSSTQAVTSMESFMIALLVPELESKCARGLLTRCVQTLRSMVTSCVSTQTSTVSSSWLAGNSLLAASCHALCVFVQPPAAKATV